MKRSSYATRSAHGALLIGDMSAASSMAIADSRSSDEETPVSLGYDRMRVLAPVFLGDTITVHSETVAIDQERRRSVSDIRVTNQSGTLVAVAQHILKWVANR